MLTVLGLVTLCLIAAILVDPEQVEKGPNAFFWGLGILGFFAGFGSAVVLGSLAPARVTTVEKNIAQIQQEGWEVVLLMGDGQIVGIPSKDVTVEFGDVTQPVLIRTNMTRLDMFDPEMPIWVRMFAIVVPKVYGTPPTKYRIVLPQGAFQQAKGGEKWQRL